MNWEVVSQLLLYFADPSTVRVWPIAWEPLTIVDRPALKDRHSTPAGGDTGLLVTWVVWLEKRKMA
jgi:hypothetical protein